MNYICIEITIKSNNNSPRAPGGMLKKIGISFRIAASLLLRLTFKE